MLGRLGKQNGQLPVNSLPGAYLPSTWATLPHPDLLTLTERRRGLKQVAQCVAYMRNVRLRRASCVSPMCYRNG